MDQPSMFDRQEAVELPPSLSDAIAQGRAAQELVEGAADEQWINAAEDLILHFELDHTFIAEEVVIALGEKGLTTKNHKAIGPVIQRFARGGIIERTGRMLPARTSHGSYKPEWRRSSGRYIEASTKPS